MVISKGVGHLLPKTNSIAAGPIILQKNVHNPAVCARGDGEEYMCVCFMSRAVLFDMT